MPSPRSGATRRRRAANCRPHRPRGLIGGASPLWHDTAPRLAGCNRNADDSIDPDLFNASREPLYAWVRQGADAGLYADGDVHAVRILAMAPKTDRSFPNNCLGFFNHGDECLRILGETPVRQEGVIDLNDDATLLQCGWNRWPGTYYRLAIDRNFEGCPSVGRGVMPANGGV